MKINKNTYIIFLLTIISLLISLVILISNKSSYKNSKYLKIHYIDVGQGDAILIQTYNKNLLIDAGSNENSSNTVSYLKNQKIKNLNYIIATHPHEDHIGAMDEVIRKFNVEKFYAPKKILNTSYFTDMIKALQYKNLKINVPKVGDYFYLDKNTKCEILAPNNEHYENVNDYSIVCKIIHCNNSFMFTGDIEKTSELEMLNSNLDLRCDVLKIAHHGSSSSSCEEFLKKTNSKIAIISCGKNNKYKHPNKKTLVNLEKNNMQIYRTDINGSVILISDGNKIMIPTK